MRVAAAVVALVLLSACGRSGATNSTSRGASPRATAGEEERDQALRKLPAEDRIALLQIGAAVGHLRSSAALIRLNGDVRRQDTQTLKRLARIVEGLRPRDPLLRRLRGWTHTALRHAIAARRTLAAARRSVQATLADAERITQGLRAYVFVHPEVRGLIPE